MLPKTHGATTRKFLKKQSVFCNVKLILFQHTALAIDQYTALSYKAVVKTIAEKLRRLEDSAAMGMFGLRHESWLAQQDALSAG